MLVPKANGKVRLYLGITRLNQTLIKQVHRDPSVNDIVHNLMHEKYSTLIDASFRVPQPEPQ